MFMLMSRSIKGLSCLYVFHVLIIFVFITMINHIISLKRTLFCQKFSLSLLLSFCLIFFFSVEPGVAYKSVVFHDHMAKALYL